MFRKFFLFVAFVAGLFAGPGILLAKIVNEQNLLVPSSAWLVGPASLIPGVTDRSGQVSCIMMNQYNNGITFKISGKKRSIMAMAIDFGMRPFEAGQTYKMMFAIEDTGYEQQFAAKAYDEDVLIINMQAHPKFYDALTKGKILSMTMGASSFDFALFGIQDGLIRMDNCSSGNNMIPKNTNVQKDSMIVDPALDLKKSALEAKTESKTKTKVRAAYDPVINHLPTDLTGNVEALPVVDVAAAEMPLKPMLVDFDPDDINTDEIDDMAMPEIIAWLLDDAEIISVLLDVRPVKKPSIQFISHIPMRKPDYRNLPQG